MRPTNKLDNFEIDSSKFISPSMNVADISDDHDPMVGFDIITNNRKNQVHFSQKILANKYSRENKRQTQRATRRESIFLTITPKEHTSKMLFDEECGNYEFTTYKMWQKIESSYYAELYHKSLKYGPILTKS